MRGASDAGGDFRGRGCLHKGDVVVACSSVEHIGHAENNAPDLEWFEAAISKIALVEDHTGGAAGPAALKDEAVLPVIQERTDDAELRSARDHAADKVLRRRGCSVRLVVVAAEVELQEARARDTGWPVGTSYSRPVGGGHTCITEERRVG